MFWYVNLNNEVPLNFHEVKDLIPNDEKYESLKKILKRLKELYNEVKNKFMDLAEKIRLTHNLHLNLKKSYRLTKKSIAILDEKCEIVKNQKRYLYALEAEKIHARIIDILKEFENNSKQ